MRTSFIYNKYIKLINSKFTDDYILYNIYIFKKKFCIYPFKLSMLAIYFFKKKILIILFLQ